MVIVFSKTHLSLTNIELQFQGLTELAYKALHKYTHAYMHMYNTPINIQLIHTVIHGSYVL